MVESKNDSVTAYDSLAQRMCKPGICIVLFRTSADTQRCCRRKPNLWLLRLQFFALLGNCDGLQQCLMWIEMDKDVPLSDAGMAQPAPHSVWGNL